MKTWFSVQAKADGSAEISIFDEIGGWGVTAREFIADLKAQAGKKITLSINSPGGSVFDALAIYNALRAHGSEVTTKTMGVAASAASMIFMAGDKRIMPANTFLMVHNPLTAAYGNAEELREIADTLDKIAASLVGIYAKSGKTDEEIKSMLDEETWLNADDALASGFATEVEAEMKIAAVFELDRLPENVQAAFAPPGNGHILAEGTDEVTDEVTDEDPQGEGEPEDDHPAATLADEISAYAKTVGLEQYAAHVALDTGVRNLADAKAKFANAREIVALCGVAGKADMADNLIRNGADVDKARSALTDALATDADKLQTSNIRPANKGSANSPAGGDVWAKIFPTAAQK